MFGRCERCPRRHAEPHTLARLTSPTLLSPHGCPLTAQSIDAPEAASRGIPNYDALSHALLSTLQLTQLAVYIPVVRQRDRVLFSRFPAQPHAETASSCRRHGAVRQVLAVPPAMHVSTGHACRHSHTPVAIRAVHTALQPHVRPRLTHTRHTHTHLCARSCVAPQLHMHGMLLAAHAHPSNRSLWPGCKKAAVDGRGW